ncbi:uncharacterized protein EI97DRAFT_473213 [Westerdykella ornata]|uniref:SMP-30/Gluconolactonase/LRE-like region domain-containing protein n=1 Tax=Westerdykella ornata TaxID=318751 RepID=A0A6A6K2G0_WESOR|nr:uncharacterized protein EI97DRAFT_473213 [Westerdykella ornata]KAF2281579.1 hypothetical protein EI97DRAFT_473213 [Westerdykella ornata]
MQALQASPRPSPLGYGPKCPPFSGNFTVNRYQLYPENADFDFNNCLLYIGVVWNASVGIYDPYTKDIEILEFDGITHDPIYHIGGVAANPRTSLVSIVVDYWPTILTGGVDMSGTNYIMLLDPETRKLLYNFNITTVTQGRASGYQDVEFDPDDNVYVVGTYPSSIVKVDSKGKNLGIWYLDDKINSTVAGFTGLAANGWTLLASHSSEGNLYRLDMRSKRGKPELISVAPPHKIDTPDAIQLPPRYKGTVLLVAELFKGVSVFRDKTGKWKNAEYRGLVEWTDPGSVVTAPVQVGDAVYMNLVPFGAGPGGGAGNATEFLYYDITAQVDALLQG